MKKKMCLLLALLSLLFVQNASAFCDSVSTRVYITTNPGNVKYVTTRSKHDFIHSSPYPVSPNTLGLTISRLGATYDALPNVEVSGDMMCISIKELTVKMGYDELIVYIDKKYKPSSCEYKVIKAHEKQHVKIAQQAMVFFKPDLEKQIQKALQKVKPQIVPTSKKVDEVLNDQLKQLISEITPLIDHINKVTAQKNYQIDTPESYAKTKAMCNNW